MLQTPVIILLLILAIIAMIVIGTSSDTTTSRSRKRQHKKQRQNIADIIDDIVSYDGDDSSIVMKKHILNPNFLNVQFHNDYRDVITSFNNIVPDAHQLFNTANIPLVYSEPNVNEVKPLISDFIRTLNKNLENQVPKERNVNSGWDEAIPDPTVVSGWDKVQKSLGLAPSLYNKPDVKNGGIKLVSILQLQKYETDDEIKYACTIVLQKEHVEDQIIIKVSIFQDKRPLRDENNFHVNSVVTLRAIIEEIFIVGYLSKYGNDASLMFNDGKEKYYDYDKMEQNNLLDPKLIQKVLLTKYDQRVKEMQQRNALLDEEGQAFHRTLPNLYDFSNIQKTRTIFDDMNEPKKFY